MAKRGTSFTIKSELVDRVIRQVMDAKTKEEKLIKSKMNAVVNAVWRTARAKRAMYTNKYGQKVSDPSAPYGVPVQTGALQGSIQKTVTQDTRKTIGRVWTEGIPYAGRIEFGFMGADSLGRKIQQAPRPFMRQALLINKDYIKKTFQQKETHA